MNEKRLNIVARYNENIEWVENLLGDTIIYNKGENFPFPYPRTDIENIGRECETFVRGIVENYEILDTYDSVAFLQGNPFDHCSNLFKILSENLNVKFIGLSNIFTKHEIPNSHSNFPFMFERSAYIFEKLLNIDKTFIACEEDNSGSRKLVENKDIEELIYILDFLGIKYNGLTFSYAQGAQYLIKTEHIYNKSHKWWIDLHKFILHCLKYLNYQKIIILMERIWPIIWQHSDS